MDQLPDLSTRLAELATRHAEIIGQIPGANLAVKQALRGVEDQQAATSALIHRCNRATQQRGVTSSTLSEILEAQQARYYQAQVTLTRARLHLKQLEWDASNLADDITKLAALIDPPAPPPQRITLLPKPPINVNLDDTVDDNIVFPGRAA